MMYISLTITFTGFSRWEQHPVTCYDTLARRILRIDQPSVFDLKSAVSAAQGYIDKYQDKTFKDVESRLKQLEAGSDDVFVTEKEEARYKEKGKVIAAFES